MTQNNETPAVLSKEEREAICRFLQERHREAVKRIENMNRNWK